MDWTHLVSSEHSSRCLWYAVAGTALLLVYILARSFLPRAPPHAQRKQKKSGTKDKAVPVKAGKQQAPSSSVSPPKETVNSSSDEEYTEPRQDSKPEANMKNAKNAKKSAPAQDDGWQVVKPRRRRVDSDY